MKPDELSERTFAAVIFDMDGTLIDSTPAVRRAWTQWAIEYQLTEEQLGGHHGMPAESIVKELVPDDVDGALARITELELADLDGVIPLPGAAEALGAVGQAAAIATSCTRELATARLKASGLPVPEVVITVDDVEHGKPAPDPFLAAASGLGVEPRDCLVVEDAPKGLQAAQAAGCRTLAVTTTSPRTALDADRVVDTLASVQFDRAPEGVRVN